MSQQGELLCDALQILEDEVGATITWAGTSYPCVGGPHLGGKLLGEGGFRVTAQDTIAVRASVFPSGLPKERQTLTFTAGGAARNLRIENITNLWGEVLVLQCNDPNERL